jgi:peptidoglycan/LPS O-acetylase OafA/YrhL
MTEVVAAPSTTATRLPFLTGLRFVAAVGVFGIHFAPYTVGPLSTVLNDVFGRARCGVCFFFILSGVVLTWSYQPGDSWRKFYQRRAARIYPDFLVTWVLAIGVIAYEGVGFYLHPGVLSLFLVQSWVPKLAIAQGWNGVTWTLSCEVFFYLAFPFLVPRVARLKRPITLLPLLCLPTLLIGLVGLVHDPHSSPPTLVWLQQIFPPVRLCEFIVGIAVGLELKRGTLPKIRLDLAAFAFVAFYLLSAWGPMQWLISSLFIPFITLGVIAGAQRNLAGDPTIWGSRRLVMLGDRAYAFYLLHQLIIRVWARADASQVRVSGINGVFWLVVLLAVAVALASLLFRCVEVPFEKRLRGSSSRRVELAGEKSTFHDST